MIHNLNEDFKNLVITCGVRTRPVEIENDMNAFWIDGPYDKLVETVISVSVKRNYDELIKAGNRAQLEKLEANSHKKGFDSLSLDYAFKRLQDEFIELFDEVHEKKGRNLKNIRHEAADIANFAHMIILLCDKGIGK